MMNKFYVMALTLILVFTQFSFAEEVALVPPTIYTLEEAVQTLMRDNLSLKLAALDIEAAKINYSEMASASAKLRRADDYGIASAEILYATKGVFEKSAELNLMVKEKTLIATETGLKIGLKQSFYSILSAQEQLKIKEASTARLKELYDVSAKKYELGLLSKNALSIAKADYEASITAVETAKRELVYNKMQFNQTMNLPLGTPFELQGIMTYTPMPAIDLSAKIAASFENRLDVMAALEAKEIAEATFGVDKVFYGSNTYAYKKSYIANEKAKLDYSKALGSAELGVRKAYDNLVTADKAYLDLKTAVAIAKDGYEIAKTMYSVGMNTQTDVSQALIQYNTAENGLNAALLGLKLAEMQFEASYSIGLNQ